MSDRVATYTQTNLLIGNNLRLQSNYAERQLQISSGFKSDSFAGVPKDTSRILNLEADEARLKQQAENTQIALDRANLMWGAMRNVITDTQDFAATLSQTLSSIGSQGADLANIATTKLNQVAGALNTQIADRYLFAGSATNTKPVDLTDPAWGGQLYVAPGPSVANTEYYQGNSYIQNVEPVDGFTVNYGVTANDPAFEKVIRAYDLLLTNPTDRDTQTEAFRLLKEGADDMAVVQAKIAQNASVMERQINDNFEDIKVLQGQVAGLKEVDVAEATVSLKQIETQLEASYTVTSTLLNLKLSDFIR